MNGNYYQNPAFPTINNDTYEAGYDAAKENDMSMQQSYIENILRHNKGKKIKAYVSFPDANEWKDKVFEGIIEQAGRDHLIISDSHTGKWDGPAWPGPP